MEIPARVQGAMISKVEPDSASARKGLQEGDVIVELDRKPVNNAGEAMKLSEKIKGPKVVARIWRQGQTRFVVIDESTGDRKSTRLNSSHLVISYAVFCLKNN